jgi:hypothetical protein
MKFCHVVCCVALCILATLHLLSSVCLCAGLEEQGLYRVGGVSSKVSKLLSMGLDRRKADKLVALDDQFEWENKTITSSLKTYLRNLPEPLMTFRYHSGFIAAASKFSQHSLDTLVCFKLCLKF